MNPIEIVLGAVLIILSVVLIVMVLMQQSKSEGLSGAIAGGAETFYGKHKGRTIEAKLGKFTAVFGIVFIVLAFVTTLLVAWLA